MFDSLLVANRGEIACRVIRSARRLGMRTIAVYSDADADAPHVEMAHEALRIGPAAAADSYLNQDALLRAIEASGAAAVHPGYGFLSENANFAAAVAQANAVFVGPSPEAMRAMGSKIEAKRLVEQAGAPVVPGYHGADQSEQTLAGEAAKIGYPLLVKAAMGGGGKGMRAVERAEHFAAALASAKREAKAAFGDDDVLLERYLQAPKHIEVQILADAAGHTLHLFERDCSLQRRHQKVLEEAPAPNFDATRRQAMGEAAVRVARAVGYVGAGTVEFVVEDDSYFFLEMNTRLQVEHPVTEAILGLDLVEWQLRIAAGEALPLRQRDLAIRGHAIEARIYAENPRHQFLPSTGTLHRVSFPCREGSSSGDAEVRVDSGISQGSKVSVYYDAMLAKLVAHGDNRQQAISRLRAALEETRIAGVEHNVAWLLRVLGHPVFAAGTHTTGFAEQAAAELTPPPDPIAIGAAFVASALRGWSDDPWTIGDGFQANLRQAQIINAKLGREPLNAHLVKQPNGFLVSVLDREMRFEDIAVTAGRISARVDGQRQQVDVAVAGDDVFAMRLGATERLSVQRFDASAFGAARTSGGRVEAPMSGRIVRVAVEVGEKVRPGQLLVVLEAMKMEHNIEAPTGGQVTAVGCAAGARVEEGTELISVDSGAG